MIKSKYFVFILIICILFSVATVSANDNQTVVLNQDAISNEGMGVNDDVNRIEITNKSYDDFYDDIKDCNDTFEIKNNYVYGESDNNKKLEFNRSNLVINGNNHVIDGFKSARGFVFKNIKVNVTINDLTFTNCNLVIVIDSGNLTLNNVNFTGNLNLGSPTGFVSFENNGYLILNNCNFNSNINSTLISIMLGDVVIYNSHFYNTGGDVDGIIIVNRKSLVIENSTFENLSSKYGGVILKLSFE